MTTSYRKSYPRAQGARKPATPQQQLQAALKRMAEARAEGADLRVIAIGKRLADNAPVYFVPSQTVLGMWHAIVQDSKGLQCDCFYSKERGCVCVHRACVFEHLKAQAEKQSAPASQPSPERPQPKAATLPSQQSCGNACNPGIADDTAEFSIFKSERPRYQPVAARAQADHVGNADGYVPGDYAGHQYR